jgi:plasmid stabilization system protein ParE
MNLEIFIKPRAELDLLDAFIFYGEQSSGLGEEFIRCVDAKLEFINRYPKACPEMYKDFRRGLISRFPFGIYYKIEEKRIVVFAVLDLRQNPESIQFRLTKEG